MKTVLSKHFIILSGFLVLVLPILIVVRSELANFSITDITTVGITLFSIILAIQGIFTLIWMLYAWENPEYAYQKRSPKEFSLPRHGFSILLPARNEELVIEDTIRSISNIDYPEQSFELLILCRADDTNTINRVQQIINRLSKSFVKLVIFNDYPINKPHSLNVGLRIAQFDYVTIFDAEDQPHPDILNIVNTIITNGGADIVQSGVQLMNFRSHWFSALNVLEYFFWFKSGLHFFSKVGQVTPLGGNTVFFRKSKLIEVGGWDENCLTEDADIGFRMALGGASMRVVYDELHTTQEETPDTLVSFIKQRTRWNQGFLQIFSKGDWIKLPKIRQKILAGYVLLSPMFNTLMLIYTPLGIWIALNLKLPVIVSMLSFLPIYIFALQLTVYLVGQWEFTRAYKLKHPIWLFPKLLITFLPYQLMLAFSSVRSLYRHLLGTNKWEKTAHFNAHRNVT